MCLRSTPKIIPELADIMSSELTPMSSEHPPQHPHPSHSTLVTELVTLHQLLTPLNQKPLIVLAFHQPNPLPIHPDLILQGLPLLLKDHDSTKIQSLQVKLNESFRNGPLNIETLMIAMDLVIAVLHEENLQHLFIKKPDCITIMQRKLDLGPWSEALELY